MILPAVYSFLYLILVIDWIKKNPTKVSNIDFSTLRGVVELFKDEAAVFAGWTHYIAFDLMIARYIVLDAVEEGIPHILIVPLVPVTLMLGPIGLFSYSIISILSFSSIIVIFDFFYYNIFQLSNIINLNLILLLWILKEDYTSFLLYYNLIIITIKIFLI